MNLFLRYSAYLDKRPFLARIATGTFFCLTGDVLTQTMIDNHSISALFTMSDPETKKFDTGRILRAGVIGVTAIGLNLIAWYRKILPFIILKFGHTYLFRNYLTATTTFLGTPHSFCLLLLFYFSLFSKLDEHLNFCCFLFIFFEETNQFGVFKR